VIKTADDEGRLFSDLSGNCVADDDGKPMYWRREVNAAGCWISSRLSARVPNDTAYVLDGFRVVHFYRAMRSLEQIVAVLPWCLSVCLSVCLWDSMHCDTVHVSADLSLMLDSLMCVLVILTPKHVHLLPAVFLQFHLEDRWGMDVQTRRDIWGTVEDCSWVTIESRLCYTMIEC